METEEMIAALLQTEGVVHMNTPTNAKDTNTLITTSWTDGAGAVHTESLSLPFPALVLIMQIGVKDES